jgi:hypothetical protein
MNGKIFGRLMAAVVCLVAVATAWDAEAGWRHRRCCYDSCYQPTYCAPVCAPVCAPTCCESSCASSYCNTCNVSYYDSCGRLVCRRGGCCETIVSSTIVLPSASCCSIASTGGSTVTTVAKAEPAQDTVKATAVALSK